MHMNKYLYIFNTFERSILKNKLFSLIRELNNIFCNVKLDIYEQNK
jgi:hypothetical protein